MILPTNGKVVVFDDQQKDIESLLRALSMEKVPFLYYQDEAGSDLPETPVENVRLVFLDLELVVNNPSTNNLISPIAARLRKVLTKNNAYILIYWSTKEDKYRTALESAFADGLKEYKPLKIISMKKTEALKSPNPAQYVVDALKVEMREFSSLIAFMLWETSVNDAGGRITNELTSFINPDEVDKGMYGLLHKLSTAQAGPSVLEGLDNNTILKLAFDLINSSLTETAERLFTSRLSDVEIGDVKAGGRQLQSVEKIILNTRLHVVSSSDLNHFYSGNLYILENNAMAREVVLRNCKKDSIDEFKTENVKLICLDVTPSCDYARRKYYSRMIYGVKIDQKFSKALNSGENRYKQLPILEIEGNSILLFDFRTIRSFSKDEFLNKYKDKPKFRLRNSLLLDIQAQLSNSINRPGIVDIE